MVKHLINGAIVVIATLCGNMTFAETGVSKHEILIGQTIGVTGIAAGPVRELNDGALTYINYVNAHGGVHGRKIKLITLDDKFDPKISEQNARILIDEKKVFAFFQNRGTPHTSAILPLLFSTNTPLIGVGTGAAIFRNPVNRLIFPTKAKYQSEVIAGMQYFASVGKKRIGIVYSDDSFGEDCLKGFDAGLMNTKMTGFKVALDRKSPDFKKATNELVNQNLDAIVVISPAQNAIGVIKAIRQLDARIQLLTISSNSSESFVKALGDDAIYMIVTQVMPSPSKSTTYLAQEFRKLKGDPTHKTSYTTLEGFLNAMVLVEGLKRAGSDLTREGLVRALETIRQKDFGGIELTYSPSDHSGSSYVELSMVNKRGEFLR
jgi:branched-chain amino acid transport system substrate-binding protein